MFTTNFSAQVQCPYCWEMFDVMIEYAQEEQHYIEDCQICCRPINFFIRENEQGVQVNVFAENDV